MGHNATSTIQYREQQDWINSVAAQHELKVYRPDYHAKTGDHNTVLLYTESDYLYNRELEKKDPLAPTSMFKSPIWTFENSDVNMQLDLGFARITPYRRLDLRTAKWKERIAGSIMLAIIEHNLREYVCHKGGYLEIDEGDDYYNDLNRGIITYMQRAFGNVYVGSVNYYGTARREIADGATVPINEYVGEKVYNFAYDFAIPSLDRKLMQLIQEWNTAEGYKKGADLVDKITKRVSEIGGTMLIWK